ncbi:acyltransferase ChoActase/COT/CPT [Polychytrium aggregatum]|uniref:acyltransferase ChoActase/COT/CPT n=1 Tax=Polychytrium aggregatum TaxID=110093 RepID=UPI0022FE4848|nr:acyltransferase ChoActase/COT/CPT [Polychytrium aggregatum]KAI9206579.1 acyltransferase ChoActase/COT/CPT [Polychytrium aggregatum]
MSEPRTFRFQSQLPKLPVPELDETCDRYLTTVKPFLSEQDFERTKLAVEEFKKGGVGQELQKRLVERAQKSETSWLIDWWNEWAYMGYRDPVVINVSYFFVFRDDKRRKQPAARAASLVTGALLFRDSLLKEELEPDMVRTTPLCMQQYKYMFNNCRIPQIPSDITRNSDPKENQHIVVMRKNQFYSLTVIDKDGSQLSTDEIEEQLLKIYEQADKIGKVPAVGALTSEHRDVWTNIRDEMLKSPLNAASLEAIESAILVLCLDDTKPVTHDEASRACWHGDGRNRFYDKSLEFIVFDNGKAGFLGEHSMMDATPTSRLCDFILEGLDNGTINHGTRTGASIEPVRLEFELTDSLLQAIDTAQTNFAALIAKEDLRVVAFDGYGKNLIKKLQVSPDAYTQMAMQLAYYRMYGHCVPTYESGMTKKFLCGRTETCRSVTMESVDWVKAMDDPALSPKEKGELGRKAVGAQSAYMAKCIDGRGVDRHLLGLKLSVLPGEPVPSLFADPAYAYSTHWYLSTSQITSEYFEGYGWGQVVSDGYGIAYMVPNNKLYFNIVSLHLRNDQLEHYLREALMEMREVFEASIPPPKPKPAPVSAPVSAPVAASAPELAAPTVVITP